MRSAWASRFLFDLCRCKTLVLIGYSASDAPVRYFLNVLEADRARFPDLRPVYALDSSTTQTTLDTRWQTLAVEPIFYRKQPKSNSHSALWQDLKKLANLVERPRGTRRAWATRLLEKPFVSTKVKDLDRVAWLFKDSDDLWEIVVTTITDPAWFDFFNDKHLWNQETASWVKAAWVAKDLQSRHRLKLSIAWLSKQGKSFAAALAVRLNQHRQLPQPWLRAWSLVTSNPPEPSVDWSAHSFPLGLKLDSPEFLLSDLQQAIEYLTPSVFFSTYDLDIDHSPPTSATRLRDILQPQLELRDTDGAKTLFEKLRKIGHEELLIDLATAKLQETLSKSLDIEGIEVDYDSNNFSVPSVEPHTQNEYHDGPVLLVQLLADLYPKLARNNKAKARAISEIWRWMPGLLGVRLWLQSMRCVHAFSADEAFGSICVLSRHQFWSIKRELLLLIRERASEADAILVNTLEQRILTEGLEFYQTFSLEPDEADWHHDARDSAVWLHLQMLLAANRLSASGTAELHAITTRKIDLNREIEEADYFDSYSGDVRRIEGNPQPIERAKENERLDRARESLESPYFEERLGWSAYCRSNPVGAFNTLKTAPLNEANSLLWKNLIEAVLVRRDENEGTFIDSIFKTLEQANIDFLALIIGGISHVYCNLQTESRAALSGWWPRLFEAAVKGDTATPDFSIDVYSIARDSTAGRLTMSRLQDIQEGLKHNPEIDNELMTSVESATLATGRQGMYARAVLIGETTFLLRLKATHVLEKLDKAMLGPTLEAVALRSVLVSRNLSPNTTQRFRKHFLQGINETLQSKQQAIAANLLRPALAIVRKEAGFEKWGITLDDVAQVLRKQTAASAIRENFLDLLNRWSKELGLDSAMGWRSTIAPLLEKVWPSERSLQNTSVARQFARLALKAGDAFPEALLYLKDHLTALPSFGGLIDVEKSNVLREHPNEMTEYLWRLFGTNESKNLHGMRAVLDQLVQTKPELEVDRRIQNLYRRVPSNE